MDSGGNALDAALEAARADYIAANPRSRELHASARTVLAGGNTRTVLVYPPFPIAMAKGSGCRLWDIDGHEYVDLCGEYTAGLFGHSEPRILQAIQGALSNGLNLAAVGTAESKFARLVCERFPSIELIRFTNSGTEANLMALTVARVSTGRDLIIGFRGAYHGGVLQFTLAGPALTTAPFPLMLGDYNDIEGALALIRENATRVAAVIVEPMLGSSGCIPARPAFLTALRQVTQEVGALLIFDEVMTSRMSGGGMQQRLGITPDLTTLGKYIAGGMSIGAFGGRADVMSLFDGKLQHAGTFNNNVLSMAGGAAALTVFTADRAEALFQRGEAMRNDLNVALARAKTKMHFTGVGSLMVDHFRAGPIERPYTKTPREEKLLELFFLDMIREGFYLARRGMIAMSLEISDTEVRRFVSAIGKFAQHRGSLLEPN
jgi:glutamate-1-semialdehyde 2,1-aminomutase